MTSLNNKLEIKYVNISKLVPYKQNARKHSDKQKHQIAASIKQFGFNNPVLIDNDNVIIAGHGRVEAAKLLGLKTVPTLSLSHMSESEKRAYIIADNRLAELAGWDEEILAIEFQHLLEIPDLNFDVEITGFETSEIDIIIGDCEEGDPDDVFEEMKDGSAAVTKSGDLWIAGEHKLYCGDSLKKNSYINLMNSERADVCFTDPPYNVPIDGHVGNSGKIQHREFAMASGEMSKEQFVTFLSEVFKLMKQFSVDGSVHFQCMDWRHIEEIITAGNHAKYTLKNLCVWVKDNGGMGSLYRSRHELVFVFKSGNEPHQNNIQLGKYGRYRTNVWEYAGVNSFGNGRMNELEMHPTVKPVAMISDAIKDCSKRNDIILDPFGGSGSTLIAAERTGRKARLIEIDPLYCDVSIRRWQLMTGQDAVLAESGQSFDVYFKQMGGENE